jgi:hypothetical protein
MKKACEDTFLSFPLHSSNYDAQIYLFLIISAHDNQKVIWMYETFLFHLGSSRRISKTEANVMFP